MTDDKQNEAASTQTGARKDKPSGAGHKRPGSGGNRQGSAWPALFAVLAILISVSLAAAAAWYWQENEARMAELEGMESEQQRQADRLQALDEALSDRQALASRVQALDDSVSSMGEEQERVSNELSRLDQRSETLRNFLDAGRSAWLVAEVEYLLRLANRELQLAARPNTALAALEAADERLQALADPGMTPVREAISRDRERLRAIEPPDITGMALTLGSLIERVESLPIAAGVRSGATADAGEGDELEAESLWRNLRDGSVRALRQLVTVRHEDAPVRPLLAPEQEYFLRRNLTLSLASARLALLQEQPQVWRDSLREARDWLDGYFEMEDDSVQAVDEELARLAEIEIRRQQPDISESLDRLRRIMEARN